MNHIENYSFRPCMSNISGLIKLSTTQTKTLITPMLKTRIFRQVQIHYLSNAANCVLVLKLYFYNNAPQTSPQRAGDLVLKKQQQSFIPVIEKYVACAELHLYPKVGGSVPVSVISKDKCNDNTNSRKLTIYSISSLCRRIYDYPYMKYISTWQVKISHWCELSSISAILCKVIAGSL